MPPVFVEQEIERASRQSLEVDPVLLMLATLDIVIEMLVGDRVPDPADAEKVTAEIRRQALISALRAGQSRVAR